MRQRQCRKFWNNADMKLFPLMRKADAYIVNTCSVTNMADRKSRQMLHRAKKMNPDAVVIAAGCYVQAAGEELLKDAAVDILIGNNEKTRLPEDSGELGERTYGILCS